LAPRWGIRFRLPTAFTLNPAVKAGRSGIGPQPQLVAGIAVIT
jgi:hypothetical protein